MDEEAAAATTKPAMENFLVMRREGLGMIERTDQQSQTDSPHFTSEMRQWRSGPPGTRDCLRIKTKLCSRADYCWRTTGSISLISR